MMQHLVSSDKDDELSLPNLINSDKALDKPKKFKRKDTGIPKDLILPSLNNKANKLPPINSRNSVKEEAEILHHDIITKETDLNNKNEKKKKKKYICNNSCIIL